MFAVTVTFDIHAEHLEAFVPAMLDNARTSRADEPGCLQFDVCQDGTRIFLYELYTDRAAFDVHLGSAHFRAFDAQVAPMVRSKDVHLFETVLR